MAPDSTWFGAISRFQPDVGTRWNAPLPHGGVSKSPGLGQRLGSVGVIDRQVVLRTRVTIEHQDAPIAEVEFRMTRFRPHRAIRLEAGDRRLEETGRGACGAVIRSADCSLEPAIPMTQP